MTRIHGLRRFFRHEQSAGRVREDIDRELAFHFEMTMRELMARGMSEEQARREANRRFGDVDAARARLTAIDRSHVEGRRRRDWLEAVAQDLRYALRGLRNRPGFTFGVVATLSLGIGANAAMFGIVDRLLFRPPAYMLDAPNTHRLYFARTFNGDERSAPNTSYKRYSQVAEETRTFDRVAAFANWSLAVGTADEARERAVGSVSASFFPCFAVHPVIGRFFRPDEDRPTAAAAVAVLGYGYWQSRYSGATDVLGKTLQIGSRLYTIIGVAPRGFHGTALTEPVAFVPITGVIGDLFGGEAARSDRWYTTHNMSWLEILAHRGPGVSLAAATSDLTTIYRRSYADQIATNPSTTPIEQAKPRGIVASVLEERGPNQGTESRVALWLIGVVAVVLLVACANVANLLLARALRRRREIALRIALGVGRGRLLAQLFTESMLLALLGGVGGLLLAQWGGQLLRASFSRGDDWSGTFNDGRTLVFAAVVALGTGLLTGLAPALHSRRTDLTASLKSGSREGSFHRSRLRTALVGAQGALSVVLLVGAGLFVRSLRNVNAVHLGYDADHLAYVELSMRGVRLDSARAVALREQLLERVVALPGVVSATRARTVPFYMSWSEDLYVTGFDSVSKLGDFLIQAGSPGYFETFGTRILKGRGLSRDDRAGSARVAVVSETMAKVLWPGKDALGQCMRVGADTMPCTTIVGVAEDIRQSSLTDEPAMQYYVPVTQMAPTDGGLFVRTRGEASTQSETIRRELQRLMPGLSYVAVKPLREILDPNFRPWQLGATMFSIFGVLALVLAAVGLYSVIAYTVTQRTQEMGVRVALGARSVDVVRLIVKDGLRLALPGIAIGAVFALAAGSFASKLLFDVPARDPLTFLVVTATLVVVALGAALVPALRASRVEPSVALRAE